MRNATTASRYRIETFVRQKMIVKQLAASAKVNGVDLFGDFWAPRPCFLPPIREVHEAADLLSEATDAMLAGNDEVARECLRRADNPAVHAFAHSIMGKENPFIHRIRSVGGPSLSAKVQERMPSAAGTAAIFARDGWRCRFCGVRVVLPAARDIMRKRYSDAISWGGPAKTLHAAFFALTATVDHVLPHAAGGNNEPDNLVTACWPCNFGRMQYLLEEMGLMDPRRRPPVVDDWDGLQRILSHAKVPPPAVATPRAPRALAKPLTACGADWFANLDRIKPGLADRMIAFLNDCTDMQMSWSANKVLIIRMEVNEVVFQVFGVEANGDVQIPWLIGGQKDKFRSFAEELVTILPDAVAYESPKMWIVKNHGKTPVNVLELLEDAPPVLAALQRLQASLRGDPVAA
jgi:hypothetical protein